MAKVNYMKKDVLLKILTKNLATHQSIYEKAMKAFRKNYTKALERLANNAKKDQFD